MSSIQLIGATYHKNKEYILHFYNSMKDEFFRCSPDKAIKLLQDPPSAYFSRSKSCDAPAPFVNLSELMLAYFGKNESTLTSKSNVFFMITNSRHFHLKIEENQKLAKAEQEEILKQAKKREKEQEELNKKLLGNLEQKVKTITDENIRLRTEMAGPNTKRSVDNTSRPPSNQNKKRRVQSPPRQMTQPNVPTNAGQQQQPLIVSTNPGQQQQPTNVPTNAGQQLQPPIVSTNSGQHHQALVPTNAGQQQPTNVPTNAAQQQQPTNVLTDAGLRQQPTNVPTNAAQQQQPMNAPHQFSTATATNQCSHHFRTAAAATNECSHQFRTAAANECSNQCWTAAAAATKCSHQCWTAAATTECGSEHTAAAVCS